MSSAASAQPIADPRATVAGADTLLRSRGLGLSIGRHDIVAALDLELRRGEILGLLGVNGAGKSSTLRLLAGLTVPSRGELKVFDGEPARDAAVRARIGYLPDTPALLRELTVTENIESQARLHGLTGTPLREAMAKLIEALDLGDLRRRLAALLSRGQAQRAALAMTLVHNPELLLLDEPTTGLDPLQISRLRTLLREISSDSAILFSSHQLPEVATLCDRILVMHQGRLCYESHNDLSDDVDGRRRLELDREVDEAFWDALPLRMQRLDARSWVTDALEPAQLEQLLRYLLERGVLPLTLGSPPAELERIFLDIAAGRETPGP